MKSLKSNVVQHAVWFEMVLSTDHTLVSFTENIKSLLDNSRYGCGIFIDLQKAFDTVRHDILLHKMEHFGIRGIVLYWFQLYLYDRKQYISINGQSSPTYNMTYGVPQGPVLSSLLFLSYINDLHNSSKLLSFNYLLMIPTFTLNLIISQNLSKLDFL